MGHYWSEVSDDYERFRERLRKDEQDKPRRVDKAKKLIRDLMSDGIERSSPVIKSRIRAKDENRDLREDDILTALWQLEERGYLDFTKSFRFKKSCRHKNLKRYRK